MIVPTPFLFTGTEQSDPRPAGLVLEVEREVFMGLLKQSEKPVVFEHHAGFPKTYRYYLRLGGFFFLFRDRQRQHLSSVANVLPVKGIFAGPPSVV